MAIKYTWDCKTVDVKNIDGNEDTVFNVHWRLTGEDENNTSTIYGSQILDTSDLANFIPFTDLKEKDIEVWVKTAIGNTQIKQKKDLISNEIDDLKLPKFQTKTLGE